MHGSQIKCAIIEDDHADARLLQRFLQKITHDSWAIEIYDGFESGKAALTDQDLDIVFVDLNLNGNDGTRLFSEGRSKTQPFPVVVVSATADDATQEEVIAAGAYDFIPKDDIDEKTLKRTIRHVFAAFKKEQELLRLADAAQKGSEAKSAFLACMSHDLRTPLNAIIGFSEAMKLSIMGPQTHERTEEYSGIIAESAQHLLSIINNILDLAKIEQKKYTLAREWLEPEDFINRQVEILQPLMDKQNLESFIRFGHDDALLLADPTALGQIFINIFSNAVKFSPEGGLISVITRMHDDALEIHIVDQGLGMTRGELKRALTPFGQASGDPNLAKQGTGLGLTIADALVSEHGGTLTVTSRKGLGTRVKITFPPSCISQVSNTNHRSLREVAV